jgi:hypothetical protein
MTKVQRPNVIESEDVIGMTMRDEHGIQMLDSLAKCLLPKVGGSVDDDSLSGMLDQN